MHQATGLIFWRNLGPDKQETRVHGWYAAVERIASGVSQWRAFIERVAEHERHVAQAFLDEEEAMAWCTTELAKHLQIVRLARHDERPVPANDLRSLVLSRLRQYDILTARRLVPQTLSHWDSVRSQALRRLEEYSDAPGLGLEGGYYFWAVIRSLNYTVLDPTVPPGVISFNDDWRQIELTGHDWGMELAHLPIPFYTAIYSFTLGVYDWLRTSDLRPYLQPGQREQDVIRQFIEEDWKIQVGLD